MKGSNGDRISKFSKMHGMLDQPKKSKRSHHKPVRLGGNQKKESDRKKGGSDYARLAVSMESTIGKPIKVVSRKDWYLYDSGVWKFRGETEQFFRRAWEAQSKQDVNPKTAELVIKSLVFRNHIDIDEKFYGSIRIDPQAEDCYLLNCPNHVLRIGLIDGKIIDQIAPSPKHMFTSCLAVDYNPEATCPLFEKICKEVLDEGDRELMLDFCATSLYPDSPHECALVCVGKGGNGKSLLLGAVASCLGEDNVTAITLRHICLGDRKHVYRLENKLMNLSTETEIKKIEETTCFKHIVSNEKFAIDRIYKSGFEMQTSCKLCFLTNNLPEFSGGSNAEARRLRVIHFPNVFEGATKDSSLKYKLATIEEKKGILKLLVDRLSKVIGMRELGYGSEGSKITYDNFRIANDLIKSFVDRCIEETGRGSDYVIRKDIHKVYVAFAREHNAMLEESDIGMLFKKIYIYKPLWQRKEYRKLIGDTQPYVIKGIKLTDEGKKLARVC